MCHQTVSYEELLEEAGIATVVMGCQGHRRARGRAALALYPLGNAAGRPRDPESQALTLELALRLLESAGTAHGGRLAAALERKREVEGATTATSIA
ncbi:MAG: hypothetical protein U1F25_01545 [Rubrivivax sp.]